MSSRSNPFERLERMFDRLSRQLDDVAHTWDEEGFPMADRWGSSMGIDVEDRDDEFVVTADVPGFEKDEIDVRMVDGSLSIEAKREESTEDRGDSYIRSEREHRSLHEQVRIPEPVREDDVEATLRNGVLTLRLPKAEPKDTGGRRIEIE